jgi:hypothetical protein
MIDSSWNDCAMQGCRGPREGGARFCAPCLRESIRQQEKYELDAHKALSALFVTPDPPKPKPRPEPATAESVGETLELVASVGQGEATGGILKQISDTLAALVERLTAGAFATPETEAPPDPLVPPAPDEPPPTDYRTPADGSGEAKPLERPVPRAAYLPGAPPPPPRGVRELHGSEILELGAMATGIVSLRPPGRFCCADIHGFRLWIPGAATLAEYEVATLQTVQFMGCVIRGDSYGPGTPASHYLRLTDLEAYGGGLVRLRHYHDILFQVQNLSQTHSLRIGVVLDVTGWDAEPPPPPSSLPPVPYCSNGGRP